MKPFILLFLCLVASGESFAYPNEPCDTNSSNIARLRAVEQYCSVSESVASAINVVIDRQRVACGISFKNPTTKAINDYVKKLNKAKSVDACSKMSELPDLLAKQETQESQGQISAEEQSGTNVKIQSSYEADQQAQIKQMSDPSYFPPVCYTLRDFVQFSQDQYVAAYHGKTALKSIDEILNNQAIDLNYSLTKYENRLIPFNYFDLVRILHNIKSEIFRGHESGDLLVDQSKSIVKQCAASWHILFIQEIKDKSRKPFDYSKSQ